MKKIKFPSCCQAHPNNFEDPQEWHRGSHPIPSCPNSGIKPCRALGFAWKCPLLWHRVLQNYPKFQSKADSQVPGTGEWAGPAVSSLGISRMDPQPAGILPWAVSSPASSSLTLLLAFFPLEIAPGLASLRGTEAAAPSRGLFLALPAGKQPEFPDKVVFFIIMSPLPAILNIHQRPRRGNFMEKCQISSNSTS